MKKKPYAILIATAVCVAIFSATILGGCATLGQEEAYGVLSEAYRNTLAKWSDIYQWEESIREKAEQNQIGRITNTTVNVHCDVAGDDYVKDSNYAVTINEAFYEEIEDASSKITTTLTGKNSVVCALAADGVDRLYVTRAEGKTFRASYQDGVSARAFTASQFYREKYSLESRLTELGGLQAEDMIFEFDGSGSADGSAKRQGILTKLVFRVSQRYLEEYAAQTGKKSTLDGAYVDLEIVNVSLSGTPDYRISNLYVYKIENLGGLQLDYEAYTLKITYLGPNIAVPKLKDKVKDDSGKEYTWERAKLFEEGLLDGVLYDNR